MSRENCVWVVGSTPPPVGGVTVFIKYFREASQIAGLERKVIFGPFSIKKALTNNYSHVSINVSNSFKRFFMLCFFKVIGKKAFFVKHGGVFDFHDPFVRGACRIADGIFCLNSTVWTQLAEAGISSFLHTTVFQENAIALSARYPEKNLKNGVLFYINNSRVIDGVEIHGASFFAQAMKNANYKGRITIIDLSNQYRDLFRPMPNVVYRSEPVDFCELLSEHEIYIRCTATDGMSVALLEAGLLGVKCLASDAVPRPDFVRTYIHGDQDSFLQELNDLLKEEPTHTQFEATSVTEVIDYIL